MDGRSLLTVVRRRNAAWRSQLDLEHATCYRAENDWAALTDARGKYVFNFFTGAEQLFDLAADPGETTRPVGRAVPPYGAGRLARTLAGHLAARGEAWVKDGRIRTRPRGIIYGPNYPKSLDGPKE